MVCGMGTWRKAGSTAVITGGASGIGLAAASRLVADGMHVVTVDRDEETIDYMLPCLERGEFYILCPDNETPRALDEKRIQWTADDLIKNRPALTEPHGSAHFAGKAPNAAGKTGTATKLDHNFGSRDGRRSLGWFAGWAPGQKAHHCIRLRGGGQHRPANRQAGITSAAQHAAIAHR